MLPEDPRHGTNAGHRAHVTHGVPFCQPCRDAHAAYRRHLRTRKYLRRVDSLMVPSLGIRRRVRALQAIGYTLAQLDQATGRGDGTKGGSNYLWNVINHDTIRRDTADKIIAMYERLSGTPGPSARSRALAANRGWAPPLAWDDIDDPSEQPKGVGRDETKGRDIDPVVVRRILNGDWRLPCTVAEKAEVARRFIAAGGSASELGKRTGWKVERYYQIGEVA